MMQTNVNPPQGMASEDTDSKFIHKLPEEILLHILSFLPLKEAVRTRALSRSWKTLWSPLIFSFNVHSDRTNNSHNEAYAGTVMQVIAEFLHFSCRTHELLKILLRFRDHNNHMPSKIEKELIVLAARGVDKDLCLNFSEQGRIETSYDFKLEVMSLDFVVGCHSKFSSFASLKTLHLRSVSYLAGDLVSTLFSECVFLESLKLEECHNVQSLQIKAGDSLGSLMVLDCPSMAEITLSAQNLKSFTYRGVLPRIEMKNTLNVIDVTFDMKDGLGQNEFDCEELLLILSTLADVQLISISSWILEWLCYAGVIFRQLNFKFNKLKSLHLFETFITRSKRDSLACFLDICPSIETLSIHVDETRKNIVCPHFYQYWHEPYFWEDHAILKSATSRLDYLKVVEIKGFEIKEDSMMMLDLLLRRALLLNAMVVTCSDNQSWDVVKFPLTQLRLMNSSKKRQALIRLSPNKDYYFGFLKANNR